MALLLALGYIIHLRRKKHAKRHEDVEEEGKMHPTIMPWVPESMSPPPSREAATSPPLGMRKPPYPADTIFHRSSDHLMGSPPATAGHSLPRASGSISQGYHSGTSGMSSSSLLVMNASNSASPTLAMSHPPHHKPLLFLQSTPPNSEIQSVSHIAQSSDHSRHSDIQTSSENTRVAGPPTSTAMRTEEGTLQTPLDNPPPYLA
jgi:hypothetical protein